MKDEPSILRSLGLMLAKEEHSTAKRPVAMAAGSVCAWCQKERGERGQPGQNHGICERHRAEMDAEIEQLHGKRAA